MPNGDGITGKANYVYDPTTGQIALGRFGWKASAASALHQTVGAYNEDMGVTSPYLPDEPCVGQLPACAAHAPDVTDTVTELVAMYIRTLGVPARRALDDPTALRGEQLFQSIGCAACHIPTFDHRCGARDPGSGGVRRFTPTPICSCTTWGRASPTAAPTIWPVARNGARRRSGASA